MVPTRHEWSIDLWLTFLVSNLVQLWKLCKPNSHSNAYASCKYIYIYIRTCIHLYLHVHVCTCTCIYVAHLEGHVVIFPSHASFLDIASVKHTGIIIAHKLLYCTCTYIHVRIYVPDWFKAMRYVRMLQSWYMYVCCLQLENSNGIITTFKISCKVVYIYMYIHVRVHTVLARQEN